MIHHNSKELDYNEQDILFENDEIFRNRVLFESSQEELWGIAKKRSHFCNFWDRLQNEIDDLITPMLFIRSDLCCISWNNSKLFLDVEIYRNGDIRWNFRSYGLAIVDAPDQYVVGSSIEEFIVHLKHIEIYLIMDI